MTEEKKKNRQWVKNAAIIFLIVLLLLTFFSNTIMNRSLPEVSVKYAESGTITTRIRGTGTVEPIETFEVKAADSRVVKRVAIQLEQQVHAGDLLFTFAQGDSAELDTLKSTLKDMQYQYQKALISATEFDYARENRNIQKLKEQVEEATAEMNEYYVSDSAYAAAKKAVDDAKAALDAAVTAVEKAEEAVSQAQEDLNSVSAGDADYRPVSYAYNAWMAAKEDITKAKDEQETAALMYGADYQVVENEAIDLIKATAEYLETPDPMKETYIQAKLPVYLPHVANQYKDKTDGTEKYYTAYTVMAGYNDAVAEAQDAADAAYNTYVVALDNYNRANAQNSDYYEYKDALTFANNKLKTAQKNKTAAEKAVATAESNLSKLEESKDKYKTAAANVRSLEAQMEDAIFELAETQKSDEVTQALEALDLGLQRDKIADMQKQIAELEGGSGGTEITADVSGIVKKIGITAGSTSSPDQVLAVIEVPDRGYKVEMAVTLEQSKKVTVGDFADVSTGWWGARDITARLTNIRTDPNNPQQSRLLVFEVSGADVESGSQLSLSIGQKSQNFEVIVPNSALRSDANGDFVYIITAKNTPLGNRYKATRVDVQVLAKDDVNSAVTGVAPYDYVITTSTRPIENGMQVRMADT